MANLLSTNVSGRLYVSGYTDTNTAMAAFRFYDGSTFRGGLGLDDWAHSGSAANITMYVNGDNNFFISTSGTKRAQFNSTAAIFRTYTADNGYNIRITAGDQFNAYYNDSAATMYINWNGGTTRFGGEGRFNSSLYSSGYVHAENGGIRIGEIWGFGGVYRSEGSMLFGVEGGAGWSFRAANTEKLFIGNDGNIYMAWAGAYISTLLDAKQNASTAINAGNIGSQSVSYASSAGNSTTTSQRQFNYLYTEEIQVGNFKTYNLGSYSAAAAQARKFLIAQIGIDYNDWNSVGLFEVEIAEKYYYSGERKRYVVNYGYGSTNSIHLVEANGVGSNNADVIIEGPTQIGGDHYILSVYIRVKYYAQYSCLIRTTRSTTGDNPPGIGQTRIVSDSEPIDIDSFSIDNLVWPTSGNHAIVAPIFYDSQDTGYYLDPNSTSRLAETLTDQNYTYGWYRNYGSYGLYNQTHGNHFYATNDSQWNIGANGGAASIAFKTGGYEGSLRGSVYADAGDNIGFLNNAGVWSLRTSSDRKAYIYGNTLSINVGEAEWSSIFMHDGDEGTREIHCNSNRIGFLTQAGSWAAWNDDSNNWFANGYVQSFTSMYSPIYYDGNDSNYYVDPNSNSYLSTLRVADAVNGVSLHVGVGSTHGVYTLDNNRKYLVVSGDYYPHMALVARYENNADHGAVFSFVGSEGGSARQWNIGIPNQNPFLFSIGYNATGDANPHYGVGDGWSSNDAHHARLSIDRAGNTKIRGMLYVNGTSGGISTGSAVIHAGNIGSQSVSYATSAGNSATTSQTDFPTLNTGNVISLGYNLNGTISTSAFRGINFHSFGDLNYYIGKPEGAWTQPLDIHFYTGIRLKSHSGYGGTRFINLATGNQLMSVGDGDDFVRVLDRLKVSSTMNINYDQVWTSSGNLHLQYSSDGNIDMNYGGGYTFSHTSFRAPIFYDSADTTYFLDPNASDKSLNIAGNIDLIARSASWAEGIRVRVPSTSTWGGIRFTRDRGDNDGNWAIGFTGINASDDLTFWANNNGDGGSMKLQMDKDGNSTFQTSVRAPIFYDSADTGYYVDPNSTSVLNNLWLKNGGNNSYSPRWDLSAYVLESQHWYAHTATQTMYLGEENVIYVRSTAIASESFRAPIFYDSQDTNYYVDPNATSRMYRINYDYLYYAPDTNYGFLGTNVYADTINSGYNSDPLELVYYRGTEVRVGMDGGNKDIRAGRFVNGVDTTYYIDLDNTAASMYAAGYIKAKYTYRNNPSAGLPGQDYPVKTASGVLATYSGSGASSTYIIIKTRIPQDWFQMGGFTIDLFGDYYNSNNKTTISLGGYWDPENNGGFLGFEYNTTNPNVRPDITVMRDITDGMTCFAISGMTWSYPIVVARDLFLGYNSSDIEGGLDWSIFGADDLGGYTNNDGVLCRNAFPADQWYGSTYVGSGSIYSPVFYDSNDTNYYLDPNNTSRLHIIKLSTDAWNQSSDGYNRLYFGNNARTYFGSGNGYEFRSAADANIASISNAGDFVAAGDVTAYSDARIKTNVQTIENALEKTLKLRGVTYSRTDSEDISTKVGVIAQEILEVIPEVVKQNDEGMYSVSYGNLTAVLIEAIKEQQKQIDELKEIINGLTK